MENFDVLNEFGEFENVIKTREECHKHGLWHKAVVVFIFSKDSKKILLQKRASSKKLWPDLWDVSAGGHVRSGEFGIDAVLRETNEELGIKLADEDVKFLGATTSKNETAEIKNNHYNEYFIAFKDVDLTKIKIQTDEVQEVRWFEVDDLVNVIKNNFDGLTGKTGCWNYLLKYLEMRKGL
ncbi:MAG: NUDIX domain-containing protein [Clostridia bacterium]|nr:NUDIX domain-containing protein [Clostridia bacterium]